MNAYELIRHRRSVRTFDGAALKPEDAQALMAFAEGVGNPWDLPITWKLLSARADGLSSPVIVGTDAWIAGKLRRAPHAEEAFGYTFERVVLYAEAMGLGTTWIAGTMDRPAFEKAMALEADEVMPCVSPVGYPAAKMSIRETLMRKGVKADVRLPFGDLFFDGSFDHPLTGEKAGRLEPALELVRWAPSAVNKQPWRVVVADHAAHFYERRSRGYVDATGWDLQKVDVGIALCHFACALEQMNVTPKLTVSDPGIAVPENTFYVASYSWE